MEARVIEASYFLAEAVRLLRSSLAGCDGSRGTAAAEEALHSFR